MPFGDGTAPFFSPNPQSGYPAPPPEYMNLRYPNLSSILSTPTTHCPKPQVDGKTLSDKYDDCFMKAAQSTNPPIEWHLLKALAATESGSDFSNTIQKGGLGRGVMQVDMGAHKQYTEQQLLDPCYNIQVGANILADNYKRSGNILNAVAQYKGNFQTYQQWFAAKYPNGRTGYSIYQDMVGYLKQQGVSV